MQKENKAQPSMEELVVLTTKGAILIQPPLKSKSWLPLWQGLMNTPDPSVMYI